MIDPTSVLSGLVAQKRQITSLNDLASQVLAMNPSINAAELASTLKAALFHKDLSSKVAISANGPSLLNGPITAPHDPVSDAIQIAEALVKTGKYTTAQVAGAIVSPELYPNLTALQLGTVLLAPGVYPGLPREQMQQALQGTNHYTSDAIADALKVLYPSPPPPVCVLAHRWAFAEPGGNSATDLAGSVAGTLSPSVSRNTQGPFGSTTVHIDGSNGSLVNFGTAVGQFRTNSFSVALWFKTSETYRYFDIIGNRTAGSHGNFFCIRMMGNHESGTRGRVTTEVDEDGGGRNYIPVNSSRTGLNDGQWHHVAVVRDGASLKLYIDGALSGSGDGPGTANIANGNPFILGRSLVGVHDKFAPNAQYADLRVYSGALTVDEVAQIYAPGAMLIHRWNFAEPSGPAAKDLAGNVNGTLSPAATRAAQGPPGQPTSVHIDGSDGSFVSFAGVGQFGPNNFSVALWFNTSETLGYFDIVGNRTASSHGVFFCIRMTGIRSDEPRGRLSTEVDQNEVGYIGINSGNYVGLGNGQWHHVVVVREAASLKIYVDGEPARSGASNAIANIVNGNPFKLGRSVHDIQGRFAPNANYTDLRIYNAALNAAQVKLVFNNKL